MTLSNRYSMILGLAVATFGLGVGGCSKHESPVSNERGFASDAAFQSAPGAPSGQHYNLNIIGSSKPKNGDLNGSNRHTIFVPLEGETQIDLSEGPEFVVLDGNGTDGFAAFQLPDPDEDNDGITAYSVYARALGTPGGSATMTTCYTDENGDRWCSTENIVIAREEGGVLDFENVSRELLTICRDTDSPPDGECDEREFLFDDDNHDYYWHYDNEGLKVAQLRFHPVATVIGLDP